MLSAGEANVRSVALQRTTTSAGLVATGAWMAGIVLALSVSLLEGMLPDWILGAIALGIILVAITSSVVIHRRVDGSASRWMLHYDARSSSLEDARDASITRLSSDNTRRGVYCFTPARGPERRIPTIVTHVGRRLVIGAPAGVVATDTDAVRTPLPHVVAPDSAAWEALRRCCLETPSTPA